MDGDVTKASGSMLSRFARSRARGTRSARCEAHVGGSSVPRQNQREAVPTWRPHRDVRFWLAGLPLAPGLEVALAGTRRSMGAENLMSFLFCFGLVLKERFVNFPDFSLEHSVQPRFLGVKSFFLPLDWSQAGLFGK